MEARLPCPTRIIEDAGGAFGMGLLGGSVFHYIKGFRNAPHGARRAGAFAAMRTNAPRLGSSFCAWGGTFAVVECALQKARGKDDSVNAIASGVITGAVLAARQGKAAMIISGVIGGAILTFIEGVTHFMSNMGSGQAQMHMQGAGAPGAEGAAGQIPIAPDLTPRDLLFVPRTQGQPPQMQHHH
jgi:import inner membrane translocase subunit TIM17|eukprot:TRINITY_DN1710_c0_g1_i2.p1 TRINITY_DN1710_c0_g1~~TRINITY_DN1710_c0_g1_i2.p1  ORF type:complete len:185 (+),score=78.54 TRINITY_DN1710_c0_g1_i2:120-674(+)